MTSPGAILPLKAPIVDPSLVYICIFSNDGGIVAGQPRVNTWRRTQKSNPVCGGSKRDIGNDRYALFSKKRQVSPRDMGNNLESHPNQLILPGSFSRPNETIWDAGRRTFMEQTGFDIAIYAKTSSVKLRAKRFDDIIVNNFKEHLTSFYCIYINISNLPYDDIGRTVGLYEPGNQIYDNFNTGLNSKKSFRHAINFNMPTHNPPCVDNDELEWVMFKQESDILPLMFSKEPQASFQAQDTVVGAFGSSFQKPSSSPLTPRIVIPSQKNRANVGRGGASSPTEFDQTWLRMILSERERICHVESNTQRVGFSPYSSATSSPSNAYTSSGTFVPEFVDSRQNYNASPISTNNILGNNLGNITRNSGSFRDAAVGVNIGDLKVCDLRNTFIRSRSNSVRSFGTQSTLSSTW